MRTIRESASTSRHYVIISGVTENFRDKAFPHAPISMMREYEANALLTTTRIRLVVSAGKVSRVHT
jgi:hypothetical protein